MGIAVLAVTATAALARPTSSAITGVVRDSSGAPIPGVVIRLSHAETAASVEAVSDAQGMYSVTALAPAPYRLEARLDGFEPIVRVVALTLGQAAEIDITLKPARFTEGVIVTARRVEEVAQEVPIPVSVLAASLVADAGAFNVNRLKELMPTVQFYRRIRAIRRSTSADLARRSVDERWHRTRRRNVHRRHVLRAPRGRDARFPRCRTGGGAARTAGNAVRQEHHGWHDQCHDANGQFTPESASSSITEASGWSRPRRRSLVRFQQVAGRVSFSGTTRDGMIRNVADR